jgi:hypothetical protein
MDYPNTGALFRTKEKKGETSPDMFGAIKIDKHFLLSLIEESDNGLVEIKMSGWSNTSKTGTKYLSLKVNTMGDAPKPKVEDDDLPF